jgi:hypothetical protein
MRTLALLSVLQSMATGAYIVACMQAGVLISNWPFAVILAISNGAFARYVMSETRRKGSANSWKPVESRGSAYERTALQEKS